MNTWREEKKINRPLLYATGGLVLGETMALFLTADQGFFWLAAMLLSFAAPCPEASGGEEQGAEAGRRLFFYTERRDHGSGMD